MTAAPGAQVIHWQPITGCAVASVGCLNCRAMRNAGGPLRHHPSREGLTVDTENGPVWRGIVRLNEDWLGQPLALARPAQIAICTQADLFNEAVPDAWLDRIFRVIHQTPWHVYQVTTKRAGRMRAYLEKRAMNRPPRNVFFGVAAERQEEAAERIPELFAAPVDRRYVVFYPLLGPIAFEVAASGLWRSGALAFAAIGEEPERPADPAWRARLAGELAGLGIPVLEARPDPIGGTAANGFPETAS